MRQRVLGRIVRTARAQTETNGDINSNTGKEEQGGWVLYQCPTSRRSAPLSDQFEGKSVLCNCDDPYESHFFKYFALNFNFLKLRKLVATCYAGSSVMQTELPLYDVYGVAESDAEARNPYKIEITEVVDTNADGTADLVDVAYLLRNKKNVLTVLKGDGDFRSPECVELMRQTDIVVTNPPFSLFREFMAQLMALDKKFLIIGSKNAITYLDIFSLIKEDKLWMGHGFPNGNAFFRVPDAYDREWAQVLRPKQVWLIQKCKRFTNRPAPQFRPLPQLHAGE